MSLRWWYRRRFVLATQWAGPWWVQSCWGGVAASIYCFSSLSCCSVIIPCFSRSSKDKKILVSLHISLAYLTNHLLISQFLLSLIVWHIHFSWNNPLLKWLLMTHGQATENTNFGAIFSASLAHSSRTLVHIVLPDTSSLVKLNVGLYL